MTYGDIRDTTLKLINQYTRIGNRINLTYNEQDDVINRIPALANSAMLAIARGPRPIEASAQLHPEDAKRLGSNLLFTLPEDLIDIQPGGLLILHNRGMTRSSDYKQLNDDQIVVPYQLFRHTSAVMLQYYRRPQLLSDNPADDDPMDNVVTAQEPIPYYCAANIMLELDAYQHSVLFNMWQDKLNELAKPPQAEHNIVESVYGDAGIWNWGYT